MFVILCYEKIATKAASIFGEDDFFVTLRKILEALLGVKKFTHKKISFYYVITM